MNKFKFLRVSIFATRYHHRHRVYYHHGPLSSSYSVPLGQGRPSRQVLPSVVSPCSTRWCTSRRSPLLQHLQLIFVTNFNLIATKKCEESQERQERRERQEQKGKETQEKTNILAWHKYRFSFSERLSIVNAMFTSPNGNQDRNLITFPCNSNSNGRRTRATAKVVF